MKFIGIEIGGTKLQMVTGNESGSIDRHFRATVDLAAGAAGIRSAISDCLEEWQIGEEIAGLGVGFGGPVDWQRGVIRTSHHVEGWAQFDLKGWLEEKTQKPVAIDNDANTAALGEALHGAGIDFRRVFYMTIGSGIGGGMVVDGNIYHGRAPGEVEIGHLRLNKTGLTLESACSGWAVNTKVLASIEEDPGGLLARLHKDADGPPAALLVPAIQKGDTTANRLLAAVADDIGFALSHVVHLFHPDVLIIGGGLSLLGEPLRAAVAQSLEPYIMQAFLPPPPLHLAVLGENVVPTGALALARSAIGKQQNE